MHECYTGTGDNKVVRYRKRDLDTCLVFARTMRADGKGPHVGIMKGGKVIFSTDIADPEYEEFIEKQKKGAA